MSIFKLYKWEYGITALQGRDEKRTQFNPFFQLVLCTKFIELIKCFTKPIFSYHLLITIENYVVTSLCFYFEAATKLNNAFRYMWKK